MNETPSPDTMRVDAARMATERASETTYRSLFESSDEAFCIIELIRGEDGEVVDLVYREVNRAFARQIGLADVVGKTAREVQPNLEPHWLAAYTRAAETGESFYLENYNADGDRWFNVHFSPIGTPGTVLVAAAFNDITARKMAELALLENEANLRWSQVWLAAQKEAFQIAMNDAPLATSLGVLVRALVEHSGNDCRCAFYVADKAGTGLHHVVGMPDSYARCVDGFEISAESLSCGLAVATGEPVVTADVLEEPRWRPWLWMAREYGFRGCWSFPVETASGTLVGSFAMYFAQPREATARDCDLAAALTDTAGIIISRHREAQERALAEAALRDSKARRGFLLQFSDALRAEPDDGVVGELAVSLIADELGLDRCCAVAVDPDEDRADVIHQFRRPGVAPVPAVLRLSDFPEAFRQTTEHTLVFPDVLHDPELTRPDKRSLAAMRVGAVLAPCLHRGEGNTIWALAAVMTRPRHWTSGEVTLMEQLAERTWSTMQRARAESALRENETRYRSVVESAKDGIWLADRDGRFVEVNAAGCRMLGYSPEQYRQMGIRDLIQPDEEPRLQALVDMLEDGGQSVDIWKIRHADGHYVPVESSHNFTPGGYWQTIGRDVSERERVERELQQRSEQFVSLLRESPMGVYLVDRNFYIRVINPAAHETVGVGDDLEGYDFDHAMHVLWSRDYADELVQRVRHTLTTGAPCFIAERSEKRGADTAWYAWHIHRTSIPGDGDDGDGVVCYLSDVTAQVRARERQKLLLMEVNHRVKNTLATVQSIATQSLHNASTLEEGAAVLESRLISLSKAHNVLTREHWEGGDLHEVVENTLCVYPDKAGTSRFHVSGADVRLRPKAVVSLSMALHELATNAVKYGALSKTHGYVDIAWEVDGAASGRRFRMCWSEHGGPPVHEPVRRGFGSRLIEYGLAMDMGGEVRLDFDPDGLICTIDAPLGEISSDGSTT